MKMRKGAKIVIALFIATGLFFGLRYFSKGTGVFSSKETIQTKEISSTQVALPDAPKNSVGQSVAAFQMPTTNVSSKNTKKVVCSFMAWNSQMGTIFSNGGKETTEGSIMEQSGVHLVINRQDDCNKMKEELIKFANDYKNNPADATGTNYVAIMGDGAPAFLASLNSELSKLGSDYKAKIIFSQGKSLGEDKLMGPQSWKDNPQTAKGGTVAAYILDGDWNIAVKWCGDNGIKVNPDEKTYDADALNFISSSDFIDAAQKYISGYTEDRKVVKNGKLTGETITVKTDAVATWTPGDEMIASKKGGLVSIVSTAEYRSQMPNVLIGIDKYMQDNRPTVENMILSMAKGGDQVKSYSQALDKAGEISAQIYGEKDGAYWTRYYKGTQEADKQGIVVSLGGSRAHNLGDNIELFGLNGGSNIYAAVYKVFGDIDVALYPNLIPNYPSVEEILDLSYLKNVISKEGGNITNADKVVYNNDSDFKNVVSNKSWTIEFKSGSAEFTSSAMKTLEELYNQSTVASGLSIEIFGHTDNTGSVDKNMTLSQERADAVKTWLMQRSTTLFPATRFNRVLGRGQSEPVADNSTANGKSKNRRVQILFGK